MSEDIKIVLEGDIDASSYVQEPTTLQPGDILHVRVGLDYVGDGQGPWIPSQAELDNAWSRWSKVVPEGVTVITTTRAEETILIPVEIPTDEVAIDD